MTGPQDGQDGTRPISVAELLAKNGTIGSPPVGGRRRRRRGNSDAVTVAELTGEIPIVQTGELPVVEEEAAEPPAEEPTESAPVVEERAETAPPQRRPIKPESGNGRPVGEAATPTATPRVVPPERAPAPLPRRGRGSAPERSHYPRPVRNEDRVSDRPPRRRGSGAELMSPDPIVDDTDVEELTAESLDDVTPDALGIGDTSYLQSTGGALFGGETIADDIARRGVVTDVNIDELGDLDEQVEDDEDERDTDVDEADAEPLSKREAVLHGAWVALQCLIAVVFGGALFIAFDQLWKWDSIVALVLGVLVILGLVIGVRIVRKTEDIGSTLTAVAVGALVTFGPLALLQAN